jgi:transcriptional regulator with XRE-family HTH domain
MISRIKELIDYSGLSARAFAIKCGLKDNTFSNQLNGVREVSLNTITSILLTFENISAEWLLRGKGEMLLTPEAQKAEEPVPTPQEIIGSQQRTIESLAKALDLLARQKRE